MFMKIYLLGCIIYEDISTIPGGAICINSSTAVSSRKKGKTIVKNHLDVQAKCFSLT